MRYNPFKRPSDSGPAPSVIDQPKPTAKRRGRSLKPKRTKRQPIDAAEALQRATVNTSMANYPAIFEGFTAKGIPESEILPRENVFTFDAWRAKGRTVRRGEHGVKVATVIVVSKKLDQDAQPEAAAEGADGTTAPARTSRRGRATVFHISQTDPLGTRSAAPDAAPTPASEPKPSTAEPAHAPAAPAPKAAIEVQAAVIPVSFRKAEPTAPIALKAPAPPAPAPKPVPAPAPAPAAAVAPWRAAWLAKRKAGA
jgi:hypothetical protein